MNPVGRLSPPPLGLALLGLLTFAAGFVGQSSFDIGGRAAPPAAGAIVTDVVGGAGSRRIARVQVALSVANNGTQAVRVLGPSRTGDGTDIHTLSPSALSLGPGLTARLEADVAVDCARPGALRLPDLQLELRDGRDAGLPVSGSGLLLEACSRAAAAVRPLAVELIPARPAPAASTPASPSAAPVDERQLAVRFRSPTGRPTRITGVRAGGVDLLPTPAAPSVAGEAGTDVRLNAPATCPAQWQVAGLPSALSVDLTPEPGRTSGPGTRATVELRVGPPLTTWLLASSCPDPP